MAGGAVLDSRSHWAGNTHSRVPDTVFPEASRDASISGLAHWLCVTINKWSPHDPSTSLPQVTPAAARALLTAYASARDEWLTRTVPTLDAQSIWLVGSLATGTADDWSDLDLIVVEGTPALAGSLLTIDLPANGPAGGGYLGAMYEVAGLPLWVDWYLWPRQAAIPREARPLAGTGTQGPRDLSATLDHLGCGEPGPPPDPQAFALAMLPLAAKHLARGNLAAAAGMIAMLGGAVDDNNIADALYDVLAQVGGNHPAVSLVHRQLAVVSAL
ncbi:hypothetical protein GCM10029976_014830 [Kribbella albertanoniae]